jgi:hypothetical protein
MTAAVLAATVTRLLTAPATPQPQVAAVTGPTLVCAAYSAREIHAGGRHLFLCVSGVTGEIEGALLRRSGVLACPISGQVDLATGCYAAGGCGVSTSGCL